jgi:hypothetical protein
MASGTVMPVPVMQFLDGNGDPYSGGKLYTYAAGTTNNLATYTTHDLTGSANANPVILDAAGRAVVYLQPKGYKFKLDNSSDDEQWVQDFVNGVPVQAGTVDITGTAGEALAKPNLVYLSDGRGSRTAGKWYKADAVLDYASTGVTLGFATATIAQDATGAIRLVGTLDGFVGLTPLGADQFVSGTVGGITSTKTTSPRQVGRIMTSTTIVIDVAPARSDVFLGPVCNGRLSLESGVPVSTADQTAKTSVYFMPYHGNKISLYNTDTTLWTVHEFSQLTFALSGLTADRNYDLYVYSVNGVVTVDNNGPTTWGSSNDTSRQAASALELQDGVLVKKDAHNYRYLGTIRTTSTTGQCEDSLTKRLVWNAYHRVDRAMYYLPTGVSSWTYTLAAWQQRSSTPPSQVECVSGQDGDSITADLWVYAQNNSAATTTYMSVGIGESADTPVTGCILVPATADVTDSKKPSSAHLRKQKSEGYHVYKWLEWSTAANETTWFGTNGTSQIRLSGLSAMLRM